MTHRIRLLAPLLAGLLLCLGGSVSAEEAARLEPVSADRELLQEVVRETDVETSRPRPEAGQYLDDFSAALLAWMAEHLGSLGEGAVRVVAWFARIGWLILVGILVLCLLALLLLGLRRRVRRGAPARAPEARAEATAPPAQVDWEDRLRTSLSRGDIPGALEALWWWIASRLVTTDVDPAWTNRELMLVAGRPDLMPQARDLDRMMYGAHLPQTGDVRRLWDRLRELLP
jgi:hypothetical protein